MQSPTLDATEGLNGADLTSLSLEPALKGPSRPSHIFAFESGATWVSSSNAEGVNDWGVPLVSAFAPGASTPNGALPTSFLSLSSGSAWGGYGAAASLTGEHPKSSGD
jgi:hypothetical protein